eukprot:TRINITY_DN2963_c0_g1::TRINITY_DN2963_c0_g1_i1::g.4059::m.4059 TRINITY_DN2963_c0_g1::TRINITY_DN2963_c0_g1_i1::g.4059  ORF type:complete len:275 (+),score=25.83,Claudin_2/PF13903.1/0.00017,Claudin_2/PF13903.1/2e+03,PMP22_Claudin/PF00822.15/0.00013,PMP22_Claudin/PF00822.15/1.9e+03,Ion_trans/PF00520.26/0.012,DDDD/PF10161.4/0.23 TRINITY_DN2963_c0_g1_i1:71-826(+)
MERRDWNALLLLAFNFVELILVIGGISADRWWSRNITDTYGDDLFQCEGLWRRCHGPNSDLDELHCTKLEDIYTADYCGAADCYNTDGVAPTIRVARAFSLMLLFVSVPGLYIGACCVARKGSQYYRYGMYLSVLQVLSGIVALACYVGYFQTSWYEMFVDPTGMTPREIGLTNRSFIPRLIECVCQGWNETEPDYDSSWWAILTAVGMAFIGGGLYNLWRLDDDAREKALKLYYNRGTPAQTTTQATSQA